MFMWQRRASCKLLALGSHCSSSAPLARIAGSLGFALIPRSLRPRHPIDCTCILHPHVLCFTHITHSWLHKRDAMALGRYAQADGCSIQPSVRHQLQCRVISLDSANIILHRHKKSKHGQTNSAVQACPQSKHVLLVGGSET